MRLDDYLTGWLRDTVSQRVRPSTIVMYSGLIRHVTRSCGAVRLRVLKAGHVQKCMADARASGLSPSTCRVLHAVLKSALNDCVKQGLLGSNPMAQMDGPRVGRREMRTLSMSEVLRLFDSLEGADVEPLIVTLTLTGLRFGEAVALRWEDVSMTHRTISVQRTYHPRRGEDAAYFGEPKTKSSRRTVRFGQRVADALALQWRRQQQQSDNPVWCDNGLIFTTVGGRPCAGDSCRHALDQALERIGVQPLRLHDLRHTAATLMLSEGVHPKIVQEMLGHSSITMTLDLYSHVMPSMHAAAVAQIDTALDTLALAGKRPDSLSLLLSNERRGQ